VATPHSNKLTYNLTLCKVGDEKNREPAKLEGDFLRGRKVVPRVENEKGMLQGDMRGA
jgi:hypothetical protein